MTKEERNKICTTCSNNIIDERYGLLCGITNNIPNFQDRCKDYEKKPTILVSKPKSIVIKRKEKQGFGKLLGTGISIYLIFKLILLLIKFLNK
jgi:hypothetical protein